MNDRLEMTDRKGNAAISRSLSNSTGVGAQIVQQSTLRTLSAEASFSTPSEGCLGQLAEEYRGGIERPEQCKKSCRR
jgi:hypothetical protein